jgi:hypothetical protein
MVLNLSELYSFLCNWVQKLANQVLCLRKHISWVGDLGIEDSTLQLLNSFAFKGWSASKHFEEKNAK